MKKKFWKHVPYLLIFACILCEPLPSAAQDWRLENGLLRMTDPVGQHAAFFEAGNQNWTDYEWTVRVNPDSSYVGFYVRVAHPQDSDYINDDRKMLWFVGVTDDGASGYSKTWHNYRSQADGATLIRGQWNDVRIRVEGRDYSFFINGELSKAFRDTGPEPVLHGGLGFLVRGGTLDVDDLDVRDLNQNPLAAESFDGDPLDENTWWLEQIDHITERTLSLRVPDDAPSPMMFRLTRIRHVGFNTAVLGYISESGLTQGRPAAASMLAPGQASPEVPLPQVGAGDTLAIETLDATGAVRARLRMTASMTAQSGQTRSTVFDYDEDTTTAVLVYPGTIDQPIQTAEEIAQGVDDFLSDLPDMGPSAEYFPIVTSISAYRMRMSPDLRAQELGILRKLGITQLFDSVSATSAQELDAHGFRGLDSYVHFITECSSAYDEACLAERASGFAETVRERGLLDRLDAVNIFDELSFSLTRPLANNNYPSANPTSQMHWRQLIEHAGLSMRDFLNDDADPPEETPPEELWDLMHFATLADRLTDPARLMKTALVWSGVYTFRSSNVIKALRQELGDQFTPTANYSAYLGDRLGIGPPCDLDPIDWVNPRTPDAGSLDLPNTVDYSRSIQGGGMGSSENEFSVALLRAAARRRGLKTQLTLASQSKYLGGVPADGLRLSAFAGLIQGVKRLSYFLYGPKYGATENFFSDDERLLTVVRELNHEIAAHDEALSSGTLRRARIALVSSLSDDIWNRVHMPDNSRVEARVSTAFYQERRALFFMLRHLGYAVDLVSERDLADGWLTDGGYKLVFLSASHLTNESATALRDWVDEGGVLVSTVGGALFDEFNQPMDILQPVFGLESGQLVADEPLIYFSQLPNRQTVDTLTLYPDTPDEIEIPTLAFRQRIVPEDAVVIGTYSDQSPAAVSNNFGLGSAILLGASPGLAYLQTGYGVSDTYTLIGTSAPYNPMHFSQALAHAIARPIRDAGIRRDVFSDGLLVSGNVITHEDTMTVPLANYNVRSQPDLTVTVTGVSGRVLSVSSIAHPAIEFSQDEDVLTIGPFAMGLTDILTIPTGDEMMNTMDMGLPVDMGAQHDISFPNDMSALSDMQTEPDMNDLGVHTDMAPQTDAHLDMGLTEEERPDSRPMATDSSTPSTGTDGCACAVGTTFSTSGTHGLGFLSLIGIIVLTMPSRRRRHRDV